MNLKELYDFGKKALGEECVLLTQAFLGADRREIALNPQKIPEQPGDFLSAVEKRKSGYPLQYLLGYWYFDNMELRVREGVLIPREDTLALVEAGADYVGAQALQGLDLCAGTGAVALSLGRRCPGAQITAVELFDTPFSCLTENITLWGKGNVRALRGDVLAGPPNDWQASFDFILSNPPYIRSAEIPTLQKEVQKEPREALDGGPDGLIFYRILVEKWKTVLKPGGLLAVEIGDDQQQAVEALFRQNGFQRVGTRLDACGLPRAVSGQLGNR